MAYTLAITHHAGGVGKTTTAFNLADQLAAKGYRVLLVDLDPQADLSERLGLESQPRTLAAALTTDPGPPAIQACRWDETHTLHVIASDLDSMAGVEMALSQAMERERRLSRALRTLQRDYDFIVLDCPPNLSLLTVNALYAADGVLVPVQAQDKALRQVSKILDTLTEVNSYRDPPVALFGLVVTMMERTVMARQVEAALRDAYPEQLFSAIIPRRAVAAEDGRWQAPLRIYAAQDPTTQAYQALAEEVIARA
jgi:chromosome partitioning protein